MPEFNTENTKEILFPDDDTLNRSASTWFSDRLRNEFTYKQIDNIAKWEPYLAEAANEHKIYSDLAEFIREHVKTVGKEQAIKDFQCGLNFLHKDIANLIKEDGQYGEKTFNAFYEILQYYPLEVLKDAIRKGAKNNLAIEPYYDGGNVSMEKVQENLS